MKGERLLTSPALSEPLKDRMRAILSYICTSGETMGILYYILDGMEAGGGGVYEQYKIFT